jgi:NitT/TauT family transport system substrate-binding protein
MRLAVMEPFHSLFYAPQFVALGLGHFADEGLDVRVETAGGGRTTVDALLEGSAHVSMGGIMRSLHLADRAGGFLPHFAEVNSRNGFFLLAREPRPRFAWSDLAGRTVISFAEAPTPWQCMLTVLRRHGVDPARVTIVRDLPVAEAVAAFRAGRGDFLEQGQPVVEQLLAEGAAHLVASMGEATGPVPFSSYMTTPDFLARQGDVVLAFTRALYRTQRWMAGHSGAEIAAAVAPAFPEIDPVIRTRAVERYHRQDTWARDPVIRRAGFDTLQEILLTGSFITRRHRYEDLIDTSFAERVIAAARTS